MTLKNLIIEAMTTLNENHCVTPNCYQGNILYRLYKIKVDDKYYIGITSRSIEERLDEHLFRCFSSNKKNSCPKLFRKIKKYVTSVSEGRIKIQIEELCNTKCEDCAKLIEFKLTMLQEKTYFTGLNSAPGGNYISGKFNWNYGKHLSNEHKSKISLSNKGKIVSEDTKKKISKSNTGKIRTKEAKDNLSIAHKGLPSPKKNTHISDQQKQKLSIANLGKKHSDETKKKMSESHLKIINSNYKLTELQVIEIKKLITQHMKNKDIAKLFNVNASTISDIKRGKSWSHIK